MVCDHSEPVSFCRYELRTTDVDAAREFYTDLLGPRFWGNGVDVQPLPLQAARRGAPPHWLGYIGVDDVVGTAFRFIECGATQLGQPPNAPIDSSRVVLRDPFGALVCLISERDHAADGRVSWHVLNARDESRAFDLYSRLFGWMPTDGVDIGPRGERIQLFSLSQDKRDAGAATNAAALPHIHPQWLFFFPTENLDAALAKVRDRGGLTLPVTRTPDGRRLAVCDDPQGAAIGLTS